MISNSQTESTPNSQSINESRKRTRELEEESNEGEKMSKIENLDLGANLNDSVENFKLHFTDKENIQEITSTFYKSKNRCAFADYIWKTEITKNKFTNNFSIIEKIDHKNNLDYNFGLSNVFYSGSQSSSLIFAFQNGRGLSDEYLKQDLNKIEEFLIENDNVSKAVPEEKENKSKIDNKNKNDEMKIDIESVVDCSKARILNEEDINFSKITNNPTSQVTIQNIEITSNTNNESEHENNNVKMSDSNSDTSPNQSQYSHSSINSNNSCKSNLSNNSFQNASGSLHNSSQISLENNNSPINTYKPIDTLIMANQIPNLKGIYYNPDQRPENNDPSEYKPNYDMVFNISIINHKTFSYIFKDVHLSEIILKEIQLTSFFYSNNLPKEDAKIVVECLIKKNYNTETGFTGIVNEAMTCYMNSMLQTLNVLGYFKRAVFQIPIDEDKMKSVPFSLQRLFFDLMNEHEPVSTNKLIQSFGWSRDQIFVQHDVQEFNLLLCDIMENSMKGTQVEGTFKYLFEGKILNYIECIDVDYRSNKVESFCDLQLTVKGCRNIIESFNKYTEEEILDNDDKYQTEEFGKQKAKKGIKFESFPNVLILQLKRFEYNPRKDSMDKINDYFEFHEEIDLSSYISTPSNIIPGSDAAYSTINPEENKYSLHSVVVHKGGINSGHYYAFIRPYADNDWMMFNDELVREADYDEVFTYNYGGALETYKHRDRGNVARLNSRIDASAYILVYIKNTMRKEILCEVRNKDIPVEISRLLQKDKDEERRMEIMRQRKIKNINVNLIVKENILNHADLGITPTYIQTNKGDNLSMINRTWFNLPKELPIKEFLKFVSEKIHIPMKYIMLYVYILQDPSKITKRFNFKMNHINEDIIETKNIIDILPLYFSNKFCLKQVYLYIDFKFQNESISIMELNPLVSEEFSEDEFECSDEDMSIIYTPISNKYRFKENHFDACLFKEFETANKQVNALLVNKLFVFKYLNFEKNIFGNNSNNFALTIDEIAKVEFNPRNGLNDFKKLRNFKEIYKKYLGNNINNVIQDYDNCEVSFLLEKTSGDYEMPSKNQINYKNGNVNAINSIIHDNDILEIENINQNFNSNENNENVTKNIHNIENKIENTNQKINNSIEDDEEETNHLVPINSECLSSLFEQNCETDLFIIVINLSWRKTQNQSLSLRPFIEKHYSSLFSTVYIPIFYSSPESYFPLLNPDKTEMKIPFNLFEQEECILERLFTFLKSNINILKFILKDNIETFYLESDKRILTEDQFISEMSKDNLDLFEMKINQNNVVLQEIANYPLLKFIGVLRNVLNHHINFHIKFYKDLEDSDEEFQTECIVLFDADNNPMVKVNISYPNKLETCHDILNYIYEPVINKFYKNIPISNFFFFIQHSHGTFAYDIFADKNCNLTQYEGTKETSIQYRLQPFSDEEIESFDSQNNIKLYVALCTKEGNSACDPLIIYLPRTATVIQVKNIILEKMKKMKKLLEKYTNLTLQKMKFYTYSLVCYRPSKEILLLNSKDEEPLLNYFKNRGSPHNLLVEFLVEEKDQGGICNLNTGSFLENGNNLSVDTSYRL